MFSIIISSNIHKIINNFILSYKDSFLRSFTDTGIYYESLIRENYVNNSMKFQEEIYQGIKNILGQEKVLGCKASNSNFKVTIKIGNYRLFIEYNEENNQRFVEKIIFNKE